MKQPPCVHMNRMNKWLHLDLLEVCNKPRTISGHIMRALWMSDTLHHISLMILNRCISVLMCLGKLALSTYHSHPSSLQMNFSKQLNILSDILMTCLSKNACRENIFSRCHATSEKIDLVYVMSHKERLIWEISC